MKKRIMAVDDDEELLEELKEMLTSAGYEVETCSDSTLAVDRIVQTLPDLIMLDLKMPRKNGFQLADELRRIPQTRHTPIIAMTGFYTEKEHMQLMDVCGIKERIVKPFDPQDVISKIRTYLGKKRDEK